MSQSTVKLQRAFNAAKKAHPRMPAAKLIASAMRLYAMPPGLTDAEYASQFGDAFHAMDDDTLSRALRQYARCKVDA
jgi:hypothetical protein